MKEGQKDVLKAWIDGEDIQYKSDNGDWLDCLSFKDCIVFKFSVDEIFRIKPKNIVLSTFILQDNLGGFQTFNSRDLFPHNLRMTFSPEGKLLKAEVI